MPEGVAFLSFDGEMEVPKAVDIHDREVCLIGIAGTNEERDAKELLKIRAKRIVYLRLKILRNLQPSSTLIGCLTLEYI